MSVLGPSFVKVWTCGSSLQSGSRNDCTRIKNVNSASRRSTFWNFFGAIQVISCHDWWHTQNLVVSVWPGDKATVSVMVAFRLILPQKFLSSKMCWKCCRLDFLGSRQHSPLWLSSKGLNYQEHDGHALLHSQRHSRNASNNGGTAWSSAFSHKETTSKGIRVADLEECKCIFLGQRSDTLNRPHMCNHMVYCGFCVLPWHVAWLL